MPHNVIRSLHGLLQWPFLKISLFRGAVTTCSRFWRKDFGEAYSIHKIGEYSVIKAQHLASFSILSKTLTIQSRDLLDHVVTFLMIPTESAPLVRLFFVHLIIFEMVCSENCIWVYWANMFILWFEGETWEKEFDPKGHVCLDNPAENVMACRDFV